MIIACVPTDRRGTTEIAVYDGGGIWDSEIPFWLCGGDSEITTEGQNPSSDTTYYQALIPPWNIHC